MTERLRLAELVGVLSIATDLGMGMPTEAGLRCCVVSVELGAAVGLSDAELVETYYLALLALIGCTSSSHLEVELFGDELARAVPEVVHADTRPLSMMLTILRGLGAGEPPLSRAARVARMLGGMPAMANVSASHCEVAQRLGERLGFDAGVQRALGHVFERWDGQGRPAGLKGEAIVSSARLVAFGHDVVTYHRLGGADAALAVARERTGAAYDPRLVERFAEVGPRVLGSLDEGSVWERAMGAEPGSRPYLTEPDVDRCLRAVADFADLKTPWLSGHSSGVAALAVAAAERCSLSSGETTLLERAALIHDLGRTAVSDAIWDKPGPLSEGEWERVRLHPYYTERMLAKPRALAAVGGLAGLHHERLDGSGYHRGSPGQQQPAPARVLAAADAYHAMREPRPHRAALGADAAADELRREARAGRLCPDAVAGVLAAAGHRVAVARRERPAGLSDREVEVLRLLARGLSNKEIARRLVVSERTVHHHVEHIYDKADLSTRAGATLFAMQHDLVGPERE